MNWNWFKRDKVTNEQLLAHLRQQEASQAKAMIELRNAVFSLIKVYKCIICGEEFARLPHQSDKRCPACQRDIKENAGLTTGNSGHRSITHTKRGLDKKMNFAS